MYAWSDVNCSVGVLRFSDSAWGLRCWTSDGYKTTKMVYEARPTSSRSPKKNISCSNGLVRWHLTIRLNFHARDSTIPSQHFRYEHRLAQHTYGHTHFTVSFHFVSRNYKSKHLIGFLARLTKCNSMQWTFHCTVQHVFNISQRIEMGVFQ